MTEGHWRNLTARKMPWRPRAGEMVYATADHPYVVGADPLGDLPRLPKWKVPGPLGVILRSGSEEMQAIDVKGSWVVLICASDGHLTHMDKTQYEIAVGARDRPRPKPCLITVQVDGSPVLLDRCDWALYQPCGCIQSIHLAAVGQDVYAADEETAWQCFYDLKRERDKARRTGWRVELLPRDRAMSEFRQATQGGCPHKEEAASA